MRRSRTAELHMPSHAREATQVEARSVAADSPTRPLLVSSFIAGIAIFPRISSKRRQAGRIHPLDLVGRLGHLSVGSDVLLVHFTLPLATQKRIHRAANELAAALAPDLTL